VLPARNVVAVFCAWSFPQILLDALAEQKAANKEARVALATLASLSPCDEAS
jgi:hypothetical protein